MLTDGKVRGYQCISASWVWHSTSSLAVWGFSEGIRCYTTTHTSSIRPFPHSQQQSSPRIPLNPMFQLLDPMHTGWAALQFGPYIGPRHTLYVWLSLYPNYISSAVLPCFLSVQSNLPFSEGVCLILEISFLLLHLKPEAQVLSCFLFFSFSLLNSFSLRYVWNPHGTLWWSGSSASIYLILWENYCPCRSIICDSFIERLAFHICLHFCLLGTSQFFLASSIILFSLTEKHETLVAMN